MFLSGCVLTDPKDPFPVTKILVVDLQHGVCAEKSVYISSDDKIIFTQVADHPLIDCDGNPSFDKTEFLSGKHWIERHIKSDKQGRK